MKKTVFSKGIYLETLRRLMVVGFIALAIALIVQLTPALTTMFDYFSKPP